MNEPQYLTTERFESTMAMTNARFESAMAASDARFESAMSSIDSRFEKMDARFEKVDARFEEMISAMNGRFDRVDSRLDRHEVLIEALVSGQEHLLTEMGDVKRRVTGLEHSMDDVQYSLSTLTSAEEKDAQATINHENRIKRLEKLNNIEANSASHLIDIY